MSERPIVLVEHPVGREAARSYVYQLVLDRLGIAARFEAQARTNVRLSPLGSDVAIEIADVLLAVPDRSWLHASSLPTAPLRWIVPPVQLGVDLRPIPVLFSRGVPANTSAEAFLSTVDLFGAIFFLLTRYEEELEGWRDEHQRFPAPRSIAVTERFWERPLADEYIELIGRALERVAPGLVKPTAQPPVALTHDVDWPLANLRQPLLRTLRVAAGDAVKRRELRLSLRRTKSWFDQLRGHYDSDPFNTFDFLMSCAEEAGLRCTFYFIADHGHPELDGTYRLDDDWIRRLLRRIADRAHEIGLHGSYESWCDAARLSRELERLRQTCLELGVVQPRWGGRQHYLRWDNDSWRIAVEAGLSSDSTLGFADRIGFRSGTSHPYPTFDLRADRPMSLEERPMIAMDGAMLQAMALTHEELPARVLQVARACRRHKGTFTLNWHNSMLASDRQRALYRALLEELRR